MGRNRFVVPLVAAILLMALPATASAASSGGWNNLGPAGPGNPNFGAIEGQVLVLEQFGTDLYVGGNFNNAGGVAAADRIAKWSGNAWSAVCPTLTGDGPTGNVYSIAVDTLNGRVYAGGSFQNVGPDLADGLAVCRNGAWRSVGGFGFTSNITALEIVGRTLYIGGGFQNGATLPEADYVIAYDLDGAGYFAITDQNAAFSSGPNDIEADGAGSVYMAGNFINVDGIPQADFVVHYLGAQQWGALGASASGLDGAIPLAGGQVYGIDVAANGDLYAVGQFTNVNGTSGAGDKIAMWNGSTWSSVGATSFFGETSGRVLRDVVVDESGVIVVGNFSNAGGDPLVDGVAAFVDGDWTNVGTNAAGTDGPLTGPNPILQDLEVIGARLYIGGLDQDIGGGLLNDSIAYFRLRQPDALIKTTGAFVGNDIYNGNGKNQLKSRSVNQGATGVFTIRVFNEGLAYDTFRIQGPGNQSGMTATYMDGAVDVTAQVVAGTFLVAMNPGVDYEIELRVRVGNGVANGVVKSWLVKATSTGPGAARDAVKARVTAT